MYTFCLQLAITTMIAHVDDLQRTQYGSEALDKSNVGDGGQAAVRSRE
jgi:hypothetical protein